MLVQLLAPWLALAMVAFGQAPDRAMARRAAARRVALVIGNNAYRAEGSALVAAVPDAKAVAAALPGLGFEPKNIFTAYDADLRSMKSAIRQFLEQTGNGDTVFVYYAGHGIEVRGRNFLLPTDFRPDASELEIMDEAYSAQELLDRLESSGAKARILILDACRNNPMRRRSATRGLAGMEGSGTLIIFPTAAGKTTPDNGIFRRELLRGLAVPGIPADDAFKRIGRSVYQASKGDQTPAIYGLLLEDFSFIPGVAPATANAAATRADEGDVETLIWREAQQIGTPGAYAEYLRQYPSGRFAAFARMRSQPPAQPAPRVESPKVTSPPSPGTPDVAALLDQARKLLNQGKWSQAREVVAQAKSIDPNNFDVRYQEVALLEVGGKLAEAIQLMTALVRDPAFGKFDAGIRAQAIERLGILHRNFGQYDEALTAFRQMSALNPSVALHSVAQVIDTLRQAGRLPQAEAELQSASKKWPKDRTLASERVMVLRDQARYDQAAEEARKLFDGKNDRDTHILMAQVFEKAKRYSDMANALDAADKLSTTSEDKDAVTFMRGAMLERQDQPAQAEAQFRKILASDPNSPGALNYIGYMLAEQNIRLPEALQLIKKALELDPYNGSYLDSLGFTYFRMGQLDQAESYLTQAANRLPTDPAIQDHLADVYAKQGKTKDAVDHWQTALKLFNQAPPSDQDPRAIERVQNKINTIRATLNRNVP